MSDRPFVHLHCHTHYSLLDGASRIPELVGLVRELGMSSVAITDHGNLYGAVQFYRECKAAGVNPIVGYEAYVAPDRRTERTARRRGEAGFHLTLLARNNTGFKNLVKMASLAYIEGFHFVPRIDKELLEAHAEGLVCLSGCASGEFSDLILKGRMDEAEQLAVWFHKVFGDHFYVEIQNNGLEIQRLCAQGAIDVANKMGLPLVATCDAHYLRKGDAGAHDVLLCINTGAKREDEKRMRYGEGDRLVDQFYVRPPEEMYALFPGLEEAVGRSQEIADGVEIELDFKSRHFPVFNPPGGKTPEDYLRELCHEGLRERYGDAPRQEVLDRLEHELGIICRMGFASYFLIVRDFVRFAVENHIPCSARGSACGALVSFVLRLSHVDPLDYDLLFERFLDPSRSEAPDIDIDFCQERRDDVIAYVRERYGEESVAQIATFGTLAARAAIKDVGRVLNVPFDRVNQLTNLVPVKLGITITDALTESPELRALYETDGEVKELIDIARKLEGTNRQTGIHAAGVVIADGPLMNHVPLHRALRKGQDGGRGSEAIVATQWEMGDLEKVGMLKMDFLGLRTLTVLDNALRLIEQTRGEKIDLENLSLDDPKTYQLLQRGDTKGVFQFESEGIRELLKRLRPDNIRDIVACTALYRPGPLQGGMVDMYINRKHGLEQPTYEHPVMEEVLKETYGVLVYQEQIMRILNGLGGIELSKAYLCIKAISKKKHDIIDQRRADFIAGAKERGVEERTAEQIFALIVFFGGYGFNKCLVADTTLVDAITGERTTIGSLSRRRRPFTVHALGEDGRLRPRPVSDVVWNGPKPVFELATIQGKRITATANHPFRTLNGWTNLADLKPGDRIAAPRRLGISGGTSWPRHSIIALAGLLSEGNVCHPSSLYVFGQDPVLVADFAAALAAFPQTVVRTTRRRSGLEVCANLGADGCHKPKAERIKGQANRCGAFLWADRLGILGRRAPQKAVPAEVFQLPDEELALFLGRLWAGDGFIANHDQAVPYYATSSPVLARDVQTLLLRLGIISGVHAKDFKYRGGRRPGYTVHLLGEGSIQTFLERITPHALGREESIAHLRRQFASKRPGKSSKDTIPAQVREWVNEERQRVGLTWVELERRSGVSTKELCGKGSAKKLGFRRGTLAKLAAFFTSRRLDQIATSDVFWDRVVSIEPKGVQDTYDLTVEVDHNFVADGLIVHNSHSAAYAHVSYHTAYLKAHYPAEFMAALLSSEVEDGNKRDILVEHIEDARRMGVDVLPPDVNTSESDFAVRDGKIVFGLAAIKGCGRSATEALVKARKARGPFTDLFDFCERVDTRTVTQAAMERLIKAGAMDSMGGHRAQLAHAEAPAEELPEVAPWEEREKLAYEKEVLDFYFSSHPLAQYEKDLARLSADKVAGLNHLPPGKEVTLGGMLVGLRLMNTKKARNGNSRYARFRFEDLTGSVECVLWPDDFVRCKDEVRGDEPRILKGTIEKVRDDPSLVVTKVMSLEQAQREFARGLFLLMPLSNNDQLLRVDAVAEVLRSTPGPCPVHLVIRDRLGRKAHLKLAQDFWIDPSRYDKDRLEGILGTGTVRLT